MWEKEATSLAKDGKQECLNCQHVFTGSYCNICGQKVAHRLKTKDIVHDIIHGFTHTDKGIFSFIPLILRYPGHFALDYVAGKRKRYFNILQYLIIIVGLVTFLMSKSNYMDLISSSFKTETASARVSAFQTEMSALLQRYLNLFLFALIPVFTFFQWLFFKKRGYNYAENFVLQMAIQAQINTISLIVIMPLAFILSRNEQRMLIPVSFIVLLSCYTLGYRQFFKVSWLQSFFKGLLIYICTNLFQVVVITIVVLVYILTHKR
jgi:hypothetical protein